MKSPVYSLIHPLKTYIQQRVEMLGISIEIDIELDEITTMTVHDTPIHDEGYCLEIISEGEEVVPLSKNFVTASADIDIQ